MNLEQDKIERRSQSISMQKAVVSSYRTSNALLTQLPSEQNVLFPAPKRNQKQQFLLTGRERAGPTGSMLLEVYFQLAIHGL